MHGGGGGGGYYALQQQRDGERRGGGRGIEPLLWQQWFMRWFLPFQKPPRAGRRVRSE